MLSPQMQRAVFDFGWSSLWPLQDQAIEAVLRTDQHILVAGDTASGKTEAALLPILSLPLPTSGFSVLYLSPMRALLNSQLERATSLGAYAGVMAHLWHSDVPGSRKDGIRAKPSGMLLTTPESLEAMCIYRAQHLPSFFASLQFVVVDELHAFLGTERGAHLHSLLHRVQRYATGRIRRIGLSATVGDRAVAVDFLGRPCIVCEGAGPRKALRLHLRYAPEADVSSDLFQVTQGHKALIFCNSRARVEQTTYTLNRLAHDSEAYLPHHGSLHQRERRHAESVLRVANRGSIVCTSTLELGIDVGAVDLVAQVDCTHSVGALRQRLGRSGRGVGRDRVGQLYATDAVAVLQTVAVVELMRRGWVEPPDHPGPRYDVLWHQALSEAVERGLPVACRDRIPDALLVHMVAEDHLTRSGDVWIAGLRGERLAHSRDFCGVFRVQQEYDVCYGTRILGQLPPLPIYQPGTALLLAGKVWTVTEVDHRRDRIGVEPGSIAHPPVFTSQPVPVHGRVREEMVSVLLADTTYPYVDDAAAATLVDLRGQFRQMGLAVRRRPVVVEPDMSEFHAFAGDRVANALALLLQLESGLTWEVTALGGVATTAAWAPLEECLHRYAVRPPDAVELGRQLLDLVPDDGLKLPKFGPMLPPPMRRSLHAAATLDVAGALRLLGDYQLVSSCADGWGRHQEE